MPYSPYNYYAWQINSGSVCAVQFAASGPISGFSIVVWMLPGDTLTILDADFGTTPDDIDVMLPGITPSYMGYLGSNTYGYDIWQYDFEFASLDPGTYWLILQNAVCASGNAIFWDLYPLIRYPCWKSLVGYLTPDIDGAGTFTFKCDGAVSGAIS